MSTLLDLINTDDVTDDVQEVVGEVPVVGGTLDNILADVDSNYDWEAIGQWLAGILAVTVSTALWTLVKPYVVSALNGDEPGKNKSKRMAMYVDLGRSGEIDELAVSEGISRAIVFEGMEERAVSHKTKVAVIRAANRITDGLLAVVNLIK